MSITKYTTPNGKRRWRARTWDPTKRSRAYVRLEKIVAAADAAYHEQPDARNGYWLAHAMVEIAAEKRGGWRHLGNTDTKTEAQALVDADAATQARLSLGHHTVAGWRDLWLQTSPVGDSTKEWHRDRTANFAREHGDRLLHEVTRTDAIQWVARSRSEAQALSAMWGAAVKARIIHDHIWQGLIVRKTKKIKPGWFVATDVVALIDAGYAVHGPDYGRLMEALITIGAYVGLRPGELGGLRWIDLDPAAGVLHVRQQANSTLKRFTLPKNGLERSVVYPPIAQDAVARMPRLHDELLFVTKRSRVLYAPNRNTIWNPVRSYAHRPTMRMHELRHYAVTWLREHGVSDSDVAEQTGHQDGGVLVRDVYDHSRSEIAIARVRAALDTAAHPEATEAAS